MAKRSSGEVGRELGADSSTVSVGAGDGSPDGAGLLAGDSVDVSDALSDVEVSLVLGGNTLDLDEGGVVVSSVAGTLEGNVGGVNKKTVSGEHIIITSTNKNNSERREG